MHGAYWSGTEDPVDDSVVHEWIPCNWTKEGRRLLEGISDLDLSVDFK